MITGDDELQLDYLFSPIFQLQNTAGRPLTDGYIELYIHGTRTKYYAYSDWNGTLHPFQIPLDSIGSNIVLASPNMTYDAYIYNRYGNMVMSRYNIATVGSGGGGTITPITITSSDETVNVSVSGNTYDLSVMDLYEAIQAVTGSYATIEYVDNSVSAFVTEERVSTMIDEALSGYEPGEIYTGGQYVQITDENVINVTGLQPAGNYLTPEDLNGYATVEYVDNSVSSFTTHTEVYNATVTAIQAATANVPEQLEAGDYISIVNNTINVTGLQPAGDYATDTEVHDATVTAIQAVTGLIPDAQVQSDWAQTDSSKVDYIKNKPTEQNLVAGDGIDITVTGNNVVISSTAHGDVTEADLYNATVTAVQTATAQIPDVSDFATEAEVYNAVVTGVQLATGLIPDVSDYATHTEVYNSAVTAIEYVTAMIPDAQVQSDWAETNSSDPSYIQNKPAEKQLVAGDGISITSNSTGVIINSAVTSIEGYATEAYVTAAVAGKKDKQNSLSFTGGDTWTVTGVYQDANGEIEVEWAPIPLDGFITEEQLIEAVSAVTGIGDYGRFYATNITGAATLQKVRGTLDVTNDGKIELKQGGSYHVTVRGGYVQSVPTNEYTTVGYVEYVTNNTISINVDNTVTATQYFEISYDIYPLANDTNYYVFFSLPSNATITNLNIDVHAIGHVGTGSGGGGGSTEYDAGWGIQILNNTISVDPSIIPSVSNFATEAEVYDATVTAIEHVTGLIPAAQVQSDWTEDDSNDPSYIQNKPTEKQLVAGDNITITSNATGVIISSTASGGGGVTEAEVYDATVTAVQTATGLIPDTEEIQFEEIDITQFALASAIPDVTNLATHTEVYDATVTAIEHVTSMIPAAQVQSDWIEDDTSDPAYIQNKPEEKELVAGQNITITETATAFVINADVPTVTGYVTEAEVYNAVVTGVQLATGLIPDTSDMATQTWVGQQGYLTEVPSTYATDTEVSEAIVTGVQTATGWVDSQGYLTSVPSTYATDTEVSEAIASSITDFVTESQVTAMLPDTESVTFEELDITQFALASAIPDVTNYTTKTEVYNATVTAIETATGAIPDTEAVTFEELDITQFAQASAIPVVTGYATHAEVYESSVTAVQTATGLIPDVSNFTTNADVYEATVTAVQMATANSGGTQVQADWTEDDTSDPSYIQNKPDVLDIVAGEGVTITETATSLIINAEGKSYTAGQYVSINNNNVITVTGLPTFANINDAAVTAVQTATAANTYTAGDGIDITNKQISLDDPIEIIPGNNITITVTGASAIFDATGGGTSYTAGDYISIDSNVISVTGVAAATAIPDTEVVTFEEVDLTDFALASSVTAIPMSNVITTAGITDIQMVTALPASPVSTVLYIIPEA